MDSNSKASKPENQSQFAFRYSYVTAQVLILALRSTIDVKSSEG